MSDPTYSLQTAIFEVLVDAGVCGGRIYDRVPTKPKKPYVTIGNFTVSDDSNSCWEQSEIFADVHIWSDSVGRGEAQQQAALVRDALNVEIAVDGFSTKIGRYQSTRYPPTGDALTAHAVVSFRYTIQHPNS